MLTKLERWKSRGRCPFTDLNKLHGLSVAANRQRRGLVMFEMADERRQQDGLARPQQADHRYSTTKRNRAFPVEGIERQSTPRNW